MALFVVRAKLAVAPSQSFPYPSNFSFVDVPGTAFAYPAVLKMKELGITTGCTFTAYCPDDFTTRGQMSAFLILAFLAP
jgi:hypothetical protein